MVKKFLVFILSVTLVLGIFVFPSGAAGAQGIDFAYRVQGGTVTNVDELLAAFTDSREGNGTQYARRVEGKENAIELTESVILNAPIIITGGSYTVYGRYLTIYRGFDNGSDPMFLIVGASDSAASLTFENAGDGEWSNPMLTLDGNSEQYPSASTGMVMLKGRATLTANKGVLFKNASTYAYGGAVFAEIDEYGTERTPLIPEIKLNNCKITDCFAAMGGGAVALNGYYYGTNGGLIAIKNSVLSGNSSDGEDIYGCGGAIYSVGGEITLDGVTFEKNSAHYGGAVYTVSETEITSCNINYNSALIEGGGVYCARQEGIDGSVAIAETTLDHNTSSGNGGAVSNYGSVSISGISAVTYNEAVNGGAVYNEGTFKLLGGSMMSNTASKLGGGIYSSGSASSLVMQDGEININNAEYCGAIYSEGSFEMSGGAIGNNKGELPHVLIKGSFEMSGGAFVLNDVIGLCVTETNGIKNYPCLTISGALTSTVTQNIGYFREKLDSDGQVKSYKNATKNGLYLLSGSQANVEAAPELFNIRSRGLFSYKLSENGTVSVRFIFIPIWGWLLILLAVLCTVAFIFRRKILQLFKFFKKKLKKKKKPAVYNGNNKGKIRRK